MTDNVFLADQVPGDASKNEFLLATIVTANSTDGTVTLQLDGMTEANQKSYKTLSSAWPLATNDRVVLMKKSGTYVVMGKVGPASGGGGIPDPTGIDADAWRIALGLGDASGHLPITTGQGGTGNTSGVMDKAMKALAIPTATVDNTSTSSAYTVTVTDFANESALRDGMVFMLYNNKATAGSSATLNVNGLGAKPIYDAFGTAVGSYFEKDSMFLMWYNASFVTTSGTGCWFAGSLTDRNWPTLTTLRAIAIPASGQSVSYNLSGMYSQYELVRWNFSSSPEYNPPVNLSWSTHSGYFTITNNGGTTSETIRPTFIYPLGRSATSRT